MFSTFASEAAISDRTGCMHKAGGFLSSASRFQHTIFHRQSSWLPTIVIRLSAVQKVCITVPGVRQLSEEEVARRLRAVDLIRSGTSKAARFAPTTYAYKLNIAACLVASVGKFLSLPQFLCLVHVVYVHACTYMYMYDFDRDRKLSCYILNQNIAEQGNNLYRVANSYM